MNKSLKFNLAYINYFLFFIFRSELKAPSDLSLFFLLKLLFMTWVEAGSSSSSHVSVVVPPAPSSSAGFSKFSSSLPDGSEWVAPALKLITFK